MHIENEFKMSTEAHEIHFKFYQNLWKKPYPDLLYQQLIFLSKNEQIILNSNPPFHRFLECGYLERKKLPNAMPISQAVPPPNSGAMNTFLEGESITFELFNFYEYTFYVEDYELYNGYALNTGLSCSVKKGYQNGKKWIVKWN